MRWDGPPGGVAALLAAMPPGLLLAAAMWAARPVPRAAAMVLACLLGAAPLIHPGPIATAAGAVAVLAIAALAVLRQTSPATLPERRMAGAGPVRLTLHVAMLALPGIVFGAGLWAAGTAMLPPGWTLAIAALVLGLPLWRPPGRG